jgi:hypothetical protein
LRFAQRLADHLRELLHTGAEYLGEVHSLRRIALEARHFRDHGVEVGIGVAAVKIGGLARARQLVQQCVVHDEPKLLL